MRTASLLFCLCLVATPSVARAAAAIHSVATDRFLFLFAEPDRPVAAHLAAVGPEVLAKIEDELLIHLPPPVRVHIQERLTLPGGVELAGWIEGLAIADRNTVLLRSPRVSHTPLELETVFAHELTHLALHRRVPRGLPRWLDEGLAMLVAHELRPGDIPLLASLAATRSLTDFTGDRPSFAGTHAPRAAYAQALSMVHHLQQKGGWEGLARLLDRLAAGDGLASAAATVYGDGWHALVDGWQSAVRLRYTWLPLILSGSLVWFLASPVVGLGLVRKWRIGQRRIRAMAEEEAIAEATAELELQWDKSLRVADPPRAGETTPPEGAHDR
ncbi:MAG: hypothetical protein COW73_01545 [Nitrospirae bacterium CG18_big_fil_WC_8_21_14_2_50_70_55]|nr:hypothetical protein [Deltaproteobacteria bacterium]OIP61945.1 MAG: hypothetical protein AUK30_11010 [Nitrospirae bacterium CG2_30_70_394]PIQ06941.1 MAG: hypothetical protein COW73_01545 [Nitrospirae bacterium CG18_big_fil_WC_8_21_14_2_50_70_55]PIU79161.1 MAG: hypothetical protein COS73_04885 [Nitrospirae bacterium CG06_land_8_20_14_3_00_70_43]PIW82109.1 MAG: hypothetical protein COZ96_10385 [Nitrospirae bacterium CG_4_8_14_3_um_filter_70_85]PIX82841.1 MAG: hypothetical protein COZ33_08515 